MKTLKSISYLICLLGVIFPFSSCSDMEELENRVTSLETRIGQLEDVVGAINSNALAIQKLLDKNDLIIVGLTETSTGYVLEFSDGTVVEVIEGMTSTSIMPLLSVDALGRWVVSFDGGKEYTLIEGAAGVSGPDASSPVVKIDDEGFWIISLDGGESWNRILGKDGLPMSAVGAGQSDVHVSFFRSVSYDESSSILSVTLNDGRVLSVTVLNRFYINVNGYSDGAVIVKGGSRTYEVEISGVDKAYFQTPDGWRATLSDKELCVEAPVDGLEGEYTVSLSYISSEGYMRVLKLLFTLSESAYVGPSCEVFDAFLNNDQDNVLPDFSYAGYKHGAVAPPDVYGLGYEVYDVTDYGAVPNDDKSDRQAFLACVEDATGAQFSETSSALSIKANGKVGAIIYFPEGEYILHTEEDDYTSDGKQYSRAIQIAAGNFILKGAGRDKTTIVMAAPNRPTDESVLYSSPSMLVFKHNSGLSKVADVTADSPKGTFTVTVSDAASLSEGSWVCLTMQNNDPRCIENELKPYAVLDYMTDIKESGVKVYEYHQIRSIDGNEVTFHEPLMHEVDMQYTSFSGDSYNWRIENYQHYENVGIEDIAFKGSATADFIHHGSWEDDGGYKPLTMTRLVNSYLRRVRFTSVSEACSVTQSANVSVYDVVIDGNRGHSAIRAQQSSRVFIGAVKDVTIDEEGKTGQYHGVGVSRPSIGTVLWRNVYGNDSCFESHATQPRATLIDYCRGGWMKYRAGGADNQMPNHLSDLIIWNYESETPQDGSFVFWDAAAPHWKILPPVLVGFHGEPASFDQSQVIVDFSNGISVQPESLYEAQLQARLGAVPSWLNELK